MCYQNGNEIGEEYRDLMFVQRPLATIKVIPKEGSTVLQFQPTFESLRKQVEDMFLRIIQVNQHIPRLERYLFPGNLFDHIC